MEYTEQLETLKADLLLQTDKTRERLAELDWSNEFIEMINDAEYTPLKYQQGALLTTFVASFKNGDVFQSAKTRWMTLKGLNDTRAEVLGELIRDIEKLLRGLRTMEMDKLRKIWDGIEDECDKPMLKCEDCDYFGYSEHAKETHECECDDEDRTTKCKYCGFKATTYDRLDNHIKSKHLKKCIHECKECEYKTNSKNEFEKHTKSKSHKEKCGVVRESFKCEPCDKEYYFESKYKEHLLSVKHKKLCCK
jgi:hypothetical protein